MSLIPFSKIVEYMQIIRADVSINDFVNMIPQLGYFPKTNADYLKLYAKTFMNAKRAYGSKSKYDFTVKFNKILRIFGYCYTDTAKYNEIIKEKDAHVLIFDNLGLPKKNSCRLYPIWWSKFARIRGIS